MNIILLGAPGAGKGTQGEYLCGKYELTHISSGDLIRAEIAAKTPVGLRVQECVKKGNLVSDETVVEIVAGKLEMLNGGWLLDGFPRTLPQAEELGRYLESRGTKIDFIILLNVTEEVVVKRLAGRGREDDDAATVKKRLMVFQDLTHPLVGYYKGQGTFKEFDGAPAATEVSDALAQFIDGSRNGNGHV
ncbi:MAG: adenylate kinase [Elusimicrobia bacterium]|nr:MAG: adenylate kinase [Elusimicrobiota bacterium]